MGGLVEAVGEGVGLCVAFDGVAGPAGGGAVGVDAADAFYEGDIFDLVLFIVQMGATGPPRYTLI